MPAKGGGPFPEEGMVEGAHHGHHPSQKTTKAPQQCGAFLLVFAVNPSEMGAPNPIQSNDPLTGKLARGTLPVLRGRDRKRRGQ